MFKLGSITATSAAEAHRAFLGQFIQPDGQVVPDEVIWQAIRKLRAELLRECDWTQATDTPLSEQQQVAWREYRRSLRDIPQVYNSPMLVVWPEPPA